MTKRVTPTGEKIPAKALREQFDVGYKVHHPIHSWGLEALGYIGRPSGRSVSVSTLLEMLMDRRVALAETFIRTPMVAAPWRLECEDPAIKAFLEAVWTPLHETYMRYASKAAMLGFIPMIKYLEFRSPQPTQAQREQGVKPWSGSATPLVVDRLQVVFPLWARRHYNKKGEYDGIELTRGEWKDNLVPIENSLWVTRGEDDAFGDQYGQGRLATGYEPWWDDSFLNDLFMRHCERAIDPALVIKHPSGYMKDPESPTKQRSNADVALEVGQALRSGATVNLPSTPYLDRDGDPTSIPMWDIKALEGLENVDAFETVFTRKEADIFAGLLIPPAALSSKYAKETLGGKSMVEVLGELAVRLLYQDWKALTEAAEQQVFNPLMRWNFGRVEDAQLVTEHFRIENMEALQNVIQWLVAAQVFDTGIVDQRETARLAGIPVTKEETEEVATPEPEIEAELAREDVLYESGDVKITQGDVDRALKKAQRRVGPEFFDLLNAEEWAE